MMYYVNVHLKAITFINHYNPNKFNKNTKKSFMRTAKKKVYIGENYFSIR